MKTRWIGILLLAGCAGADPRSDAYGNFEAVEIAVAPEVSGRLIELQVEEGMVLDSGVVVGRIDSLPLLLRRRQLEAGFSSVMARAAAARSQMNVLVEQKSVVEKEKARVEELLKSNSVPQKTWDDIDGQHRVLTRQIEHARDQESAILTESESIVSQIEQLDDQIRRCRIVNPVRGTVLVKSAEPQEMVAAGKPVYQIADLSSLILRVYVSGDQLPHIQLQQDVEVWIDETKTDNRSLRGQIEWISSRAEFTPKIIQTKEERVNQVYAVKIRVLNDGRLKIGMPAEVNFSVLQKPTEK